MITIRGQSRQVAMEGLEMSILWSSKEEEMNYIFNYIYVTIIIRSKNIM